MKPGERHDVHCYQCGHRTQVAGMTRSTVCPGCNRRLIVEDIVIRNYTALVNIETCGRLIIARGGHAVAQKRVVALEGIEMDGKLQCRQAITARHARIGPHAEWKGDLQAASLDVKPGAVIHGGRFEIPSTPRLQSAEGVADR